MRELYIYHHLGLGDHIICNGIVRHYSKLNDRIYLFVKPDNRNNLKIVSSDNDEKIFHLCYVIENANEVHVTESSFRPLIEHLNMKTDKLFIHRYARGESLEISTRKKWISVY